MVGGQPSGQVRGQDEEAFRLVQLAEDATRGPPAGSVDAARALAMLGGAPTMATC